MKKQRKQLGNGHLREGGRNKSEFQREVNSSWGFYSGKWFLAHDLKGSWKLKLLGEILDMLPTDQSCLAQIVPRSLSVGGRKRDAFKDPEVLKENTLPCRIISRGHRDEAWSPKDQ